MKHIQLKGYINELGQLIVELPAVTPTGDVIVTIEAIDPEQAWFWTEHWQQRMKQPREDIAAGNYKNFDTMEAFLADLMDDNEA